MDYKSSGVDIEKGDLFIQGIKGMVESTHNKKVLNTLGGFASLYDLGDKVIAASTDGVGTKLLLAKETGNYQGIGQDLVAMCVNDLLCVGAEPLFFLDYYACGKLDTQQSKQVLQSIVDACKQSSMALVGGETAEMPGMYQEKDIDLAGFSVGIADKENIYSDHDFREGDALIGIASSGFHSNGYSLIRQTPSLSLAEKQSLLTPTKIYVKLVKKIRENYKILSMAHITGGGIENIARLSKKWDFVLHTMPSVEELPPIMSEVLKRLDLPKREAYRTFNMGIGLCLVVKKEDQQGLLKDLQSWGEKAWSLGSIREGSGDLIENF